ncbi:copper chaperone PCu(A)C [Helicobacter sp. T3_23-1059]
MQKTAFQIVIVLGMLLGGFLPQNLAAQNLAKSTPQNPLKITLYVVENVPNNNMSAAFGKIENLSDETITLNSAYSDISNATELHHTTSDSNGISKMQKVDFFAIEPKSSLILKPKSYHIMFIGLKSALKAGNNATLELKFTKNSEVITTSIKTKIIARKELSKYLQPLGIMLDSSQMPQNPRHHNH